MTFQANIERLPLEASVYDGAHKALKELHKRNLVHGDVRHVNIMVKRDGVDSSKGLADVILIDYNWAGERGSARYPSTIDLDHEYVWRPKSVKRGGPITPGHDILMLKYISPFRL